MSSEASRLPVGVGRRRFMLGAGAIATATVSAPHASHAQSVNWRMQSAWTSRDVFHGFAADYARKVEAMSGGRLRIDVVPGGAVVPPFQASDAVHGGILDASHGVAGVRYNKHTANALFSAPPSFGWDSQGFLAWFYNGGGESLYKELLNEILSLNIVGFLYFPMPTQPVGWFKKEVSNAGDFRGLRFRGSELSAELFRTFGAAITTLPTGDIVPAMEHGALDAADSNNPTADLQLGLHNISKHYVTGSHHRQAAALEIIFNKKQFDALPADLRAILRQAAFAASSEQLWLASGRYAQDFAELKKRGVNAVKANARFLEDQLKAWDQVIAERSKEPFFAKVLASQKAWVRRTVPYLQSNNLDSEALSAAYRHFFG